MKSLKQSIQQLDRKFMPQVHHSDLPEAINLLKKNGIQVKSGSVLPTKLSYSQKQVNREKVKNIIRDIQRGKKMPPLIISNDNYIVDGHHRCIAYKIIDKNKPVDVIVIGKKKNEAIKLFKEVENQI